MHFVSILLSLALTTLELQTKESTATYIKFTLLYYIIIIYFVYISYYKFLSCFVVVVVLDLKYLLIIVSYRVMRFEASILLSSLALLQLQLKLQLKVLPCIKIIIIIILIIAYNNSVCVCVFSVCVCVSVAVYAHVCVCFVYITPPPRARSKSHNFHFSRSLTAFSRTLSFSLFVWFIVKITKCSLMFLVTS